MKTRTYPLVWIKQSELLGKLKIYNKSTLNSVNSIGKPNDLKHLQSEHEHMMWDYNKME